MIELPVPSDNAKNLISSIAGEKYGTRPASIKAGLPMIYNRIDQYIAVAPYLESLAASPCVKPLSDDLVHCYESPTESFKSAKASIWKSFWEGKQSDCPYCQINEAETLDHYIPKAKYPEFSVMPQNLVPCCYHCNGKKGEDWISGSSRLFFHSYYDKLDGEIVLGVRLGKSKYGVSIEYYISDPGPAYAKLFNVVCEHFNRLGLAERYRKRASTYLAKAIVENEQGLRTGLPPKLLDNMLANGLAANESELGKNHWHTALAREICRIGSVELATMGGVVAA